MDGNMQLVTENTVVKPSPIHGWGVFANNNINNADIILQSVLVKIPIGARCPDNLMIYLYAYSGYTFLPLGHAGLINSSNTPNVKFEIDTNQLVINIIALRDIEAGEEITLNYL